MDVALLSESTLQARIPRATPTKAPLTISGQAQDPFAPTVSNWDVPLKPTPGNAVVSLRELFPNQRVGTGSVTVYSVDQVTGTELVAEGAVKPEVVTGFSP